MWRAILVHYDTRNNPTKSRHGRNQQTFSFDDGLTWQPPTAINFVPKLPDDWAGCMWSG